MKKAQIKQLVVSILIATAFTSLLIFRGLYSIDNILSDRLYQDEQALEGNVILINIDQRALDSFGPFQTWGRSIIAEVIETLNSNENSRPAVIGIDTIFEGETNTTDDYKLVKAAGQYNNVVLATFAQFGSEVFVDTDGSFSLNTRAITSYAEPFGELKEVSQQGHINAMYDEDGILRHPILQIDLPNGRQIPSFNYKIAQMYGEYMGIDIVPPPTDKLFRWYLPYQALPGSYDDGFSVADILSGELPSEMFEDKIILIGPYAAGLNDTIKSSIDHAQPMFGVEYQANAVSAILSGDYKKEIPILPQAVLLFIVSLLAILWFRNRKVVAATIGWLLIVTVCVGGSWLCWNMGYVVKSLYMPLTVTVLFIFSVADNYVHAALEKRRVTTTFQRYVAPEIVNEILREGSDSLELGGKLTDIAVLFVDLRGFTTMSEGMEPPQIVEILNRYLTLTSSCILKNNGTLDKFVGDCTMAFWGAPLTQDDCIFKAVKTALDMVDGSKELSIELQEKFGRTVSFGIGVHYGSAVVGNIGAPNRMDYTAIGDTVNTAARLEANAPGGQILVSRIIADSLSERVEFKSLGSSIQLKGKSSGFEILTVEGLKQ